MSYCRFGDDSDVYLYPGDGDWECCGCRISVGDGGRTRLESLPAVLAHLEAHRAAGHKVPDYAFSRVRHELTTGRTIFGRPLPGSSETTAAVTPTAPVAPSRACRMSVGEILRLLATRADLEVSLVTYLNPSEIQTFDISHATVRNMFTGWEEDIDIFARLDDGVGAVLFLGVGCGNSGEDMRMAVEVLAARVWFRDRPFAPPPEPVPIPPALAAFITPPPDGLDGSSVDLSVNDLAAQSGIPAWEFTEPGPIIARIDPRDQLIADLYDLVRHAEDIDDRNGALPRAKAYLDALLGP